MRTSASVGPIVLMLAATAVALSPTPASARDAAVGTNELLTVRADGGPTRNHSQTPDVSNDGAWVTFSSYARHLVEGVSSRQPQVYRRSQVTGELVLVSQGIDGGPGNRDSFASYVSADGRFVAFDSMATNLVEGDRKHRRMDVFIRDTSTETTTRLTRGLGRGPANGWSGVRGISDDGRYVLFGSVASNLVPGDRNDANDVFLADVVAGTTTLISRGTDGEPAHGSSTAASMSADGTLIAFDSFASNVVADDRNHFPDAFVHDIGTGVTTMVSRDADGGSADGYSVGPAISPDGLYVAYESSASDLLDENPAVGSASAPEQVRHSNVFLRELATGETTLVSRAHDGGAANGDSVRAAVSAGGTTVVFDSDATNLVGRQTDRSAGDPESTAPRWRNVFVVDVATGTTTWASHRADGARSRRSSEEAMVTADGGEVVYTGGPRLVAEDTNQRRDIYRWTP